MKPDIGNRPLTIEEFEKMPGVVTSVEYWASVWDGKKSIATDSSESWANPEESIFINSRKLIGFIGAKTGIRLSPECADLIEGDK